MSEKTERIISLIFSTRRVMHEQSQYREKGGSFLQLATLRHIQEKRPLMKELAGFLSITPPSATSLINNLVEAGLIRRENDGHDRRSVRLGISKKGERQLEHWREKLVARMKERLDRLGEKDKDNLIRILTKLTSGE